MSSAERQALVAIPLELERIRTELMTGLQLSRGTVPLQGAEARQITDSGGNGVRVSTSAGRLVGFSLRETTATAPALVRLLDGIDGDPLALIRLAPGESVRDWYGPTGVSFINGLFAQVVAGAVEGVAYLGAVD